MGLAFSLPVHFPAYRLILSPLLWRFRLLESQDRSLFLSNVKYDLAKRRYLRAFRIQLLRPAPGTGKFTQPLHNRSEIVLRQNEHGLDPYREAVGKAFARRREMPVKSPATHSHLAGKEMAEDGLSTSNRALFVKARLISRERLPSLAWI